MDIEKKDPSSLVEFLQGKYPKYGIDLYYDEKIWLPTLRIWWRL